MRAIWKGAVAFGLVNVPVKLYSATGEHSVTLNQVHRTDGGRIRYKKVCSIDGEEVRNDEIDKGYQTDDGRMVVLTDADLEQLPLATEREIAVEEFVPAEQVDPIMLGKTYYLEPDKTAAKPYALLREALKTTDRMAVVKVALRQRESMAVLRVRGDVICLQTLLWPDEVREADFPFLDTDVQVRPQELTMAASLVESLAGDFDPSDFTDSYQAALEQVIEAKVSSGSVVSPRTAVDDDRDGGGDVVDLLSALQRSVERARDKRAGASGGSSGGAAAAPATEGRAGTSKPRSTRAAKAQPAGPAEAAEPTQAAPRRASTAKAGTAKAGTAKAATAKAGTTKAAAGKAATGKAAGRASKGAAATDEPAVAAAEEPTTKPARSRAKAPAAATEETDAPAKKAAARRRAS